MFNPDNIIEYLHKGISLLEEKEFNDFHFDVDVKDSRFCELAEMILSHDGYDVKCLNKIEPKANELLKKNLTKDKINLLCLILDEIEIRNCENKEICTAVFASKSILRNNETDSYKLPLIFTRFIEDVYMAFACGVKHDNASTRNKYLTN